MCVSGSPPAILTDFINNLEKINQLALAKGAIVCFSSGNKLQTLWQTTFQEQGYTNFHVVGSKDCRGKKLDEYNTVPWAKYCSANANHLLKVEMHKTFAIHAHVLLFIYVLIGFAWREFYNPLFRQLQ